jgi:hypothetical protein
MNINEMIIAEFSRQDAVPPNPKVQVNIREVKWLIERKRQIDAMEIDDIEWITEDNRILEVDKQHLEDFKYTGLGNTNFIEMGWHDGSLAKCQPEDDPWDSGLGKQVEAEDAL